MSDAEEDWFAVQLSTADPSYGTESLSKPTLNTIHDWTTRTLKCMQTTYTRNCGFSYSRRSAIILPSAVMMEEKISMTSSISAVLKFSARTSDRKIDQHSDNRASRSV
jgi:hypothetical protein